MIAPVVHLIVSMVYVSQSVFVAFFDMFAADDVDPMLIAAVQIDQQPLVEFAIEI